MMRQLEVPAAMVLGRDVAVMDKLFGGPKSGSEARELQGTIFLAFPELERPDVYLFSDERIVAYLQLAHEAIPHLFYYLAPSPDAGALMGFLAGASGSTGVGPDGMVNVDDAALGALTWHLAQTAQYAESVGDDWPRIIKAYTSQLPDERLSDLVERTVREIVDGT